MPQSEKNLPASGDAIIDGLVGGSRWLGTVTVSFPEFASDYGNYEFTFQDADENDVKVDESDGFSACTETLRDCLRTRLMAASTRTRCSLSALPQST